MSRYDLDRASDAALFAVVRATLPCCCGNSLDPVEPVTRRCLKAFAQQLIDEPAESFAQLEALRAECRVKTRAEYDREIADKAREILQSGAWGSDPFWLKELRALVDGSRAAPEGEP